MNEARVDVDPSTISVRDSGPATGDIVMVVRGVVFPVAGWNDFVVVILEAWLTALVRMLRRVSDTECVHFMEGPYAIHLLRMKSGAIRVRAVDRPDHERAVAEVTLLVLVENAVRVADRVVASCRAQGYGPKDVQQLEDALAALRREVESLRN